MAIAPASGGAPRDPGLQAERTALAWRRTGLALATNALLILRTGWVNEQGAVTALGAVLLAAAGATAVLAVRRHRQLACATVPVAPGAAMMLALAGLSGLAALCAVAALVLVSPGA